MDLLTGAAFLPANEDLSAEVRRAPSAEVFDWRGGGLMETTMSERAKTVMDAGRPLPPDSADLFQLEMQASPQEEVENFRQPKKRLVPGLRAARRRWRFAFGRSKR